VTREATTIGATGYARTVDSKPVIVIRLNPGRSCVAGFVQISGRGTAGRVYDTILTVSMANNGDGVRFDPVFPPDVESGVSVHTFVEHGDIVVQVLDESSAAVDWTAKVDLVRISTDRPREEIL
jgi:hypothetical protein